MLFQGRLISVILCFACLICGYWIGINRGNRSVLDQSEERQLYLLHEGFYRVAKESLEVVKARLPEEQEQLNKRCEAHLRVYVKEVQDLRKDYDWPLLHDELYDEVCEYLKQRP